MMTSTSHHPAEIFEDLDAEDDRLETILAGLSATQWAAPSAAEGWTVRDVVVHLMQTDESVVRSIEGLAGLLQDERPAGDLDDAMARAVAGEEAPPEQIFQRWRTARREASAALRAADPNTPYPWATNALRPRVLATTRLAEHWAHALDITGPLNVSLPDTARLRHIAWLAHRTLPYAFGLAGEEAHDVWCELSGPNGEMWTFGPPDADSRISGPAGEFCRVAARRLPPAGTHLVAAGPYADAALRHLRTYAA
jgi:uncharacterized protein (TIGR03084 family)